MARGVIEAARILFAQDCVFVAGAATVDAIPKPSLPEIAFVGRSNVGKSSLINALTGRKTLARVSNTPGRTRQINFFRLGNRLMLADLPGYGFARVSKAETRAWNELVSSYLQNRRTLRRVMLLIDARRGPMAVDHEAMVLMDGAAVSYQLVLTKADEVNAAGRDEVITRSRDEGASHAAAHPDIAVTSADTAEGIPELRATLAAIVGG